MDLHDIKKFEEDFYQIKKTVKRILSDRPERLEDIMLQLTNIEIALETFISQLEISGIYPQLNKEQL